MAKSNTIGRRCVWLVIGWLGQVLLPLDAVRADDAQTFTITGAPLGEVEVCSDAAMKSCVSVDGQKVVGLTATRDAGNLHLTFESKPTWVAPVFVETSPPFTTSFGRKESQSLVPAPAAGRGLGGHNDPDEREVREP